MPVQHYSGFCYHFHFHSFKHLKEIGVKGIGAVMRVESAMPDVQLVRVWITLQSFKIKQENISTMSVLKGK